MSKREEVLSRKFFGELEVLGNSTFRTDYVECLCSCGQVCDINFYNILDGKRTCCVWCKSPKTVKAREIKNFHHLTVIGHGKSASDLKCRCACGNIKDVTSWNLLNGTTKTCGCGYGTTTNTQECLKRKTFGRYSVLSPTENRSGYVNCKCDCGTLKEVSANSLIRGDSNSCGCLGAEIISKLRKDSASMKVGQKYFSSKGEIMVITEYVDCDNVLVKFPNGFIAKASAGNIRDGEVRNVYSKSVCGVGYVGEGVYTSKDKSYTHWVHMMSRCYSDNYHDTYQDATVDKEWHNYQTFAGWFFKNWKGNSDVALDKDLLYKGNKVYSSHTCQLVPQDLNNFSCTSDKIRGKLPIGVVERVYKGRITYIAQMYKEGFRNSIGEYLSKEEAFYAYKKAKEDQAKVLADKYYSKNLITCELRDSLYNYKVEITD